MTDRIWLIFHKATVSPLSPVNMDASEFVIGISVVPAANEADAMARFYKDLADNHMELLELGSVELFVSDDYQEGSDLNLEIIDAVKGAINRNLVYYVCQATSETLLSEEK